MSSCCGPATGTREPGIRTAGGREQCPVCDRKGRRVEVITLKALLRPEALARLDAGAAYRFCRTTTCPVVYFADGSDTVFRKGDLKVRVGLKETEEPAPVCYCFGHTRGSVGEEIQRTGRSTAVESITAHIQAGRCGCEVNNPSGACCLGEVSKVVKEGLARFADRVALPTVGEKR